MMKLKVKKTFNERVKENNKKKIKTKMKNKTYEKL